ncbi:MAG: nucleotidyltransferase domain-containing protein [Bacteroidota bacterium]
MYSLQDRQSVQDYILSLARTDERVTDAAIVGSEAIGANDQWSDIDLTFGLKEEVAISTILADWTQKIQEQYQAAHLFDLPWGQSIYRVFLLPNCLQVDISFTPSSGFGSTTPNFKLLFGEAKPRAPKTAPAAQEVLGYAVHHALRARFSLERQRYWQAEYWLSACRDYALKLACLNHQCNPFDARGYDDLPKEVTKLFLDSLSVQLTDHHLREALKVVVSGLLKIARESTGIDLRVEPQLRWIAQLAP